MKIKTLLPLALSVAALGGVTTALAGGPDHMPAPPADHHLYVGGGFVINDSVRDLDAASLDGAADVEDYQNKHTGNYGWKAFMGYELKPWLDMELSFTRQGNSQINAIADDNTGDLIDSLYISRYYLDLDAIAKANIYDHLYGFVKAGMGLAFSKYQAGYDINNFPPVGSHTTESHQNDTNRYKDTEGTFNYGAGLGYEFMHQYGVRFSYSSYVVDHATGFNTFPSLWSADLMYRFSM